MIFKFVNNKNREKDCIINISNFNKKDKDDKCNNKHFRRNFNEYNIKREIIIIYIIKIINQFTR